MAMAAQAPLDGPRDELKTQFVTREGTYRLMTLSEYSRPNRIGYANAGGGTGGANANCAGAPVKVSFVSEPQGERISFNYGRELFVYPYKGVRKAADLTKPIDKRVYKGTCPTCHDFCSVAENSDIIPLLVGFSGGQIQLIDPIRKELSKLFDEERLIDKSKVTCIKWLPGSTNFFVVSHASGHLYVYNQELLCSATPPAYQLFKQGEQFAVYTCKTKSTRNPLYKWAIGHGSINEFAFSPCGHFLAVASQDGYLRVFNYDTMESVGACRSYFGGLLCVCWSPDGKFIVCGGEDDLVTVYSFHERRVVVRGQGHKSWVSVVAFDPFNMSYGELPDGLDFSGSDEEGPSSQQQAEQQQREESRLMAPPSGSGSVTCYRFGSVGQDTHICLWDMTEDILKQSAARTKAAEQQIPNLSVDLSNSNSVTSKDSGVLVSSTSSLASSNHVTSSSSSLTKRFAAMTFSSSSGEKTHKRNFSLGDSASRGGAPSSALRSVRPEESIKLGSPQCPRIADIPVIEPLVVKKIAHERLTALVFKEECLVTACQDGYVCTWARPGRATVNSSSVMCPGSPPPSNASGVGSIPDSIGGGATGNGGTIV